jgi:hypothetical protein
LFVGLPVQPISSMPRSATLSVREMYTLLRQPAHKGFPIRITLDIAARACVKIRDGAAGAITNSQRPESAPRIVASLRSN